MAFFNSAVGVLQTLVIALGAGLGIWGVINLLEGYGSDNPGAKSPGHETAHGGRRRCLDWRRSCPAALRPVQLTDSEIHRRAAPLTGGGAGKEVLPFDY